jgi:hypothetical protein
MSIDSVDVRIDIVFDEIIKGGQMGETNPFGLELSAFRYLV